MATRQVQDKPADSTSYIEWLRTKMRIEVTPMTERRYNEVVSTVKEMFEQSGFWRELTVSLPKIDHEYQQLTGYPLLMRDTAPMLLEKPYQSFLDKTRRRNVNDNSNWPEAPNKGWFLPDSCHERINDMVRTTIVVKFLDGVSFLWERINELCEKHNIARRIYYEAREDGYYAGHVYFYPKLTIPAAVGTEEKSIQIELQLTTQLKEVIKELFHSFYERRRTAICDPRDKWQWDYEGEEFVPNFLGHTLHYLEGMIMQVRSKLGGRK